MTIRFSKESTEYSIRLTTDCIIQNWDPKKTGGKPIFEFKAGQSGKVTLGDVQERLLIALAGGHDCCTCDDPDDLFTLTENDLREAHERFLKKDKYLFGNINVKEFRYDEKAGVANLTTTNNEVLRIDLYTKSEKTSAIRSTKSTRNVTQSIKIDNKYNGIPKEWIPYIQRLSKETGYSEELILNIVSYEGYTPVAKYKKENGGLWEVGFGHTTQAGHNNKFGRGFKINLQTAFKWLGQDIKDKENKIRKFGSYYNYEKLPKEMKEAFIDVAFNRGENRLNPDSASFDQNYRSVHANIQKGYLGSAAVRLRQENFYIHEAGLRKRNVQRFLSIIKNQSPEQIVISMDLFNREYYYTKTINMLSKLEAEQLRKQWNSLYYSAKAKVAKQ